MKSNKNVKRAVVQDSEQSPESELEELSKKKPTKQAIVQKKKGPATKAVQQESEEEDTPPVATKKTAQTKRGRKASMESEESLSKDKGKKVVKTSTEPIRKKSADKPKAKVAQKSESEQESDQDIAKKTKQNAKPIVAAKKGAVKKTVQAQSEESSESEEEVKKPAKKTLKTNPKKAEVESESDEIIQQPKKKGVSPKVQIGKSPKSQPKTSPKVQPKPSPKVQPKGKAPKTIEESEEESESEQLNGATKKVAGKSMIINQKPAQGTKKAAKKPVEEESEEEESEVKQPARKGSKDKKKPVKHIEQSEEEEQKPQPKGRKASKDLKKVQTKKAQHQDEEGEFEVCVQQLSFNAYDTDIRAHFEPCGNVLNVKLLTKPDGKSKGTAFVKFGLKSEVKAALQLDGSDLMGRPIKVSEAQNQANNNNQGRRNDFQQRPQTNGRSFGNNNQQQPQGNAEIESSTLFIGGLSFKSTPESMNHFFSQCGQVVGTRIVTDKETQRSRGFGYVEFSDIESAKKAYQKLNGQMLDGRQIRLDSSKPRDRPEGGGSFGGGGGNRGGSYGGNRGGDFGGNRGGRNPGNSQVDLSQDDRNLKSGSIGTFVGKRVML